VKQLVLEDLGYTCRAAGSVAFFDASIAAVSAVGLLTGTRRAAKAP